MKTTKKSNSQIIAQVETIKNKLMSLHEDAYRNTPDAARAYLEIDKYIEGLEKFQNAIK